LSDLARTSDIARTSNIERLRISTVGVMRHDGISGRAVAILVTYLRRMRGGRRPVSRPGPAAVLRAWVGAALGILVVSAPVLYLGLPASANVFLIGSFGATAVLLYAAPRSDLAQPRNVVGGHVLSALVGVTAHRVLPGHPEVAAALAVATAIALMQVTLTLHPPGGATALIAVLGPERVHRLGYRYALTPVLVSVCLMVIVALLVNNLSRHEHHHYPVTWR